MHSLVVELLMNYTHCKKIGVRPAEEPSRELNGGEQESLDVLELSSGTFLGSIKV